MPLREVWQKPTRFIDKPLSLPWLNTSTLWDTSFGLANDSTVAYVDQHMLPDAEKPQSQVSPFSQTALGDHRSTIPTG